MRNTLLKKRAQRIYQSKAKLVLSTGEVILVEELVLIPTWKESPHRISDE